MTRRTYLSLAGVGLIRAAGAARFKAAIIGDTGHGNFGHNWEYTWNRIPSVEVVAVADPSDTGRARAMERSGARRGYADYREMLAKEKPDVVAIAPRWADRRFEMVKAAVDARAHILLEKPFARSLPEADAIVALAERAKIRIQVGHAARFSVTMQHILKLLMDGELGENIELRGRGKEDKRAGGEDMVTLGSHVFDTMRLVSGNPNWVFADITEKGEAITARKRRPGSEPVGWVAGDSVNATFSFPKGVYAQFASKAALPFPPADRCGLWICGSKGVIFINLGNSRTAEGFILRSPHWMARPGKAQWEPLPSPGAERTGNFDRANNAVALDLLAAIEQDREPLCSARDGRWTIEMIAGVYQSHLQGKRVGFPLTDRRDPLDSPNS